MKHRITLIPGDGIGPEVAAAVVRIIEASGVEIEWEKHIAGQEALDKFGKTLPDELIESIQRNKVGLKGPITTPVGKGFTSVNVGLRKTLDLYANLRPVRALPNVPCRNPNLDLVVVRENTESLYSGIEPEVFPAWSRVSRSLLRKLRRGLRVSPSLTHVTKSEKKITAISQSEHHEVVRRLVSQNVTKKSASFIPKLSGKA
jgi:isocitrate dehydrogenase (NAD+)